MGAGGRGQTYCVRDAVGGGTGRLFSVYVRNAPFVSCGGGRGGHVSYTLIDMVIAGLSLVLEMLTGERRIGTSESWKHDRSF